MDKILIHYIQIFGYFGYAILFVTIFFESFPFTFFLPGDSLLFTTGFLASQGYLNFPLLVSLLFIAATVGYLSSYAFGRYMRILIFTGEEKWWCRKKHLEATQKFYDKYGAKTLVIGRFVPVVRSFSATLAGAVEMNRRRFTLFTLLGGALWTIGVSSVGFFLGKIIPSVDKLLTPIIFLIIFVSILPTIYEYIQHRREVARKNIDAPGTGHTSGHNA